MFKSPVPGYSYFNGIMNLCSFFLEILILKLFSEVVKSGLFQEAEKHQLPEIESEQIQ